MLTAAIENAGYTGKVKIGMDVAASEFWNSEKKMYDLGKFRFLISILSYCTERQRERERENFS